MATLSEKQAKLFTDRNWGVIAKYLGRDEYPYLGPGEQRVIIEIHAERIDGFGAGG